MKTKDADSLGLALLEKVSGVEVESISVCEAELRWKDTDFGLEVYLKVIYEFEEEPTSRTLNYILHWDSSHGFHFDEVREGNDVVLHKD